MRRKYVIIVQGASTDLKNTITKHLLKKKYGYWHWMEDAWLVPSVDSKVSAQELGEWLEKIPGFGTITYLVIEVGPKRTYWGRNIKPAWDWIIQNWK